MKNYTGANNSTFDKFNLGFNLIIHLEISERPIDLLKY